MKETYMHGHKVYSDDNASGGAYYLQNHTNDEEARVFFDQARMRGHVDFEDAEHSHYKLSYNQDGTYGIEHKSF